MTPSQMVVNIYEIALILSGLLAFGAIVFGAIKYTLAAGSPSEQHEGKEWITQALLGVLLLFSAYLILQTINPRLVEDLDLPTPEPIRATTNTNTPTTRGCEVCGYFNPPKVCVQLPSGQLECQLPCGPTTYGACPYGSGQQCIQSAGGIYSCR